MLGPMRAPLLNVDAGESDTEPEALLALADALNVACGGHAGDATTMQRLLRFCASRGIRAGAHPSYPDRDGFGRRTMSISLETLERTIHEQCTALRAVADRLGQPIAHAKLHGALYHDAAADPALAAACLRAIVRALGLVTIVGPPSGALREAARDVGCPYEREGFADRAVRPDGSLVPRHEPGALVTDPATAAAQARTLWRSGAVSTICVHGDTEGALAIARAVRDALDAEARA